VPGKRTFVWRFDVRSLKTIVRRPDPPAPGWDRLCTDITCETHLQDKAERIEVSLGAVPPLLVRIAAVTQVPGAIVGAHGQDTQFVLPHNLRCTVDGHVDETARQVHLRVHTDKPCHLVAWWPASWGPATVALGPTPVAATPVTFGPSRFLRFAVPPGTAAVTVRTR